MRRFEAQAYARAGLVGNPSDGYFGKTLSLALREFSARVVIYEWPEVEILPSRQDLVRFESLDALAEDVRRNGYYGGLRLVKASLKKFHDYCSEHGITLARRNFTVRYETDVPRQVGLAGSSAIITAAFRALCRFFEVEIPAHALANWVLAVEKEELGIQAGLQDRVCQAYEGLVYMDFDRALMDARGYGDYHPMDAALLPPLYLSFQEELSEVSHRVHGNLRERWEQGDREVRKVMAELADLAAQARKALLEGRKDELGPIMDRNFDLRRRIVPIHPAHLEMVEAARSTGASAKFAGSGGAIVGTLPSGGKVDRLQTYLDTLGCRTLLLEAVS